MLDSAIDSSYSSTDIEAALLYKTENEVLLSNYLTSLYLYQYYYRT